MTGQTRMDDLSRSVIANFFPDSERRRWNFVFLPSILHPTCIDRYNHVIYFKSLPDDDAVAMARIAQAVAESFTQWHDRMTQERCAKAASIARKKGMLPVAIALWEIVVEKEGCGGRFIQDVVEKGWNQWAMPEVEFHKILRTERFLRTERWGGGI
jgi:hypothetical protein